MSEMYKILQDLCKTKGITITEMCREAGVPRSSVGNLASGNTQALSAKNVQKLAAYFGVPAGRILGDTQKEKPAIPEDDELQEYLEELKNRPEMKMLFSLAKGATKEDVEKAVKIVEALLGK